MEVPEPSTVSFIGAIFESRDMEKNGAALPADRLGTAGGGILQTYFGTRRSLR